MDKEEEASRQKLKTEPAGLQAGLPPEAAGLQAGLGRLPGRFSSRRSRPPGRPRLAPRPGHIPTQLASRLA